MTERERLEKLQASCDYNRGMLEAITGLLAFIAKGQPVDVETLREFAESFDEERWPMLMRGWENTLMIFQEASIP